MQGPTVEEIRRVSAIAGQTQINARIKYPGTDSEVHGFVGTVDGHGPIVVISPTGYQFYVVDPWRFGPFGTDWIKRFYEE